jgi:hypothetical protein
MSGGAIALGAFVIVGLVAMFFGTRGNHRR